MGRTREALPEILAVALYGRRDSPEIHAVRADADRPASPTRAERQDLIETVEQRGGLPLPDHPFDLGAIGRELRLTEPLLKKMKGPLLESRFGFDGAESFVRHVQNLHECLGSGPFPCYRCRIATLMRQVRRDKKGWGRPGRLCYPD